MILLGGAVPRRAVLQLGHVEDGREVETGRLPVVDGVLGVEHLGVTDGLGHRAEPELGQ